MNILKNIRPIESYYKPISQDNYLGIIRYILAVGVLVDHFNTLIGANLKWFVNSYFSVGCFFGISGFLLAGSLIKGKSFKKYIIGRAYRLLPSYIIVVLLSSFLLSFISNLKLDEYFFSIDFWKYLGANLTFLNFLHPSLPGVFDGLDTNAVNGSLWTMKIEWQLAFSLIFVVWICRRYNLDIVRTSILIIILATLYRILFSELYSISHKAIYEILGRQFIGQSIFFFTGLIIYCYYDKFIRHLPLICGFSIAIYALFNICIDDFYLWTCAYPIVITILTLSIGLFKSKWARYIDFNHNISYEMYLCHFPIIQCFAYFKVKDSIGINNTFFCILLCTIAVSIVIHKLYLIINKK